jgi:hypothetical protein
VVGGWWLDALNRLVAFREAKIVSEEEGMVPVVGSKVTDKYLGWAH